MRYKHFLFCLSLGGALSVAPYAHAVMNSADIGTAAWVGGKPLSMADSPCFVNSFGGVKQVGGTVGGVDCSVSKIWVIQASNSYSQTQYDTYMTPPNTYTGQIVVNASGSGSCWASGIIDTGSYWNGPAQTMATFMGFAITPNNAQADVIYCSMSPGDLVSHARFLQSRTL